MRHALGNLTVLDLSHALAGPFASTMLAQYGASVIKIESPDGDITRRWGPPFYQTESAYFVHLNPNKQSVVLDLKQPAGRDVFLELAAQADIVLENLHFGAVKKLGVDYDAVAGCNDRIIYCSISGFGQEGPYRDRAALDLVLQAEAGMISVTGEAGRDGVRAGVSIADITAGLYAAFGILAAVNARSLTGRGQFVDVSMMDGQLGILQNVIGAYLADGAVPRPTGNVYPTLFPYQTFKTQTRDLALGIPSDGRWRTLCSVLGLGRLADDVRYATNSARSANRASVVAILRPVLLSKTYEEWEPQLVAAGVPIGAINDIAAVVNHPQVAARQSLVGIQHPVAGPIEMVAPVARLLQTPGAVREPAPLLGEHTDAVLRERLGYGDDRLAQLRRDQITTARASPSQT
jgi:formyl-CoA transferase/CoA:oxalate CoA-transferase